MRTPARPHRRCAAPGHVTSSPARTAPTRRLRAVLVAVVIVLTAAGCQVATDVDVAVRPDGSGTVTVTVNLDAQAAAEIPDLAAQLRTADLQQAGWQVVPPQPTRTGGLRVVARKRFGRPEQAGAVVAEVAGVDGPLRGFTVTRSHSFARTTWHVRGTVDLRRGLATFSDLQVAAALNGQLFGRSEDQLRAAAGGSLAAAAPFRVRVQLPEGGGRSYDARLGGPPVPIDTSHTATRRSAYLALGAAILCVLAAVAITVIRARRPRKPPRAERGIGTYVRQQPTMIPRAGRGVPPGAGRPSR